ncbi:PP2C family protein-serine/threonine phosphatase [Sanguibacter massiliensis]|uniref:PP2C family protein-serine/threonine phosphatase n=1 Tax=Sanguibacter massiliensis TaxID=1973217 RepID=UPI000C865F3A|nr:GAF domain-containing SpoIIE family protein phosphatase [Sanguibacter massiliensis]
MTTADTNQGASVHVVRPWLGPQPSDDPELQRYAVLASLCVGDGAAAVLLPEPDGARVAAASTIDDGASGTLRSDLAYESLRTGRLVVLTPAESAVSRPEQPVGFVAVPVTTPEGARVAVLFAQTLVEVQPSQVRALGELAVLLAAYLGSRTSLRRAVEAEAELQEITRINRILLAFSEALARTSTVDETLQVVRDLATTQLEADHCTVVLEDDGRFDALDRRGLPADRPLHYTELPRGADHPGPYAAATGEGVFLDDRGALAERFPDLAAEASADVDGEAYVPLRVGRRTGWLWLGWAGPHRTFARTRRMKQALARYVGQAIERVELVQARDAVARTLQEAMLTSLPTVPGLELAARYVPAAEDQQVGGDWYDAIHECGVTTVVIGDVVGHNIAAATRMSSLRSILRGFVADRVQTPAQLLERLDHVNLALGTGTMGTAVVAQLRGVVEADGSAHVTWSSAGHLAPVVVGADGATRTFEGTSDLMLGVLECDRHDHAATLAPGETLLLFTDGLVERRGEPIEESLVRLAGVLGGVAQAPVGDLLDVVLAEMEATGERDDIAVLAVRPV